MRLISALGFCAAMLATNQGSGTAAEPAPAADCSVYKTPSSPGMNASEARRELDACLTRSKVHATLSTLLPLAHLHPDTTVAPERGYLSVRSDDGKIGGYVSDGDISMGSLANGTTVVMMTLGDPGGTGGEGEVLLFAIDSGKPTYLGPVFSTGGKLAAFFLHGDAVVAYPSYSKDDPNCCPSHWRVLHYTVINDRLKSISDEVLPDSVFQTRYSMAFRASGR